MEQVQSEVGSGHRKVSRIQLQFLVPGLTDLDSRAVLPERQSGFVVPEEIPTNLSQIGLNQDLR